MSKIATETGNRLIDTRRNRLRALPHRRGPVLRPALAPRLQRLRLIVHRERGLGELRAAEVPLVPVQEIGVGDAEARAPVLVGDRAGPVPGAEGALARAQRQLLRAQPRLQLRLQVPAMAPGVEDGHRYLSPTVPRTESISLPGS